jgi:D-alanyl-D-alanine carboxypeptidase
MKKYVSAILVVVCVTAVFTGGIWYGVFQVGHSNYTSQLGSLIEAKWTDYTANKTGFGGGLAMLILSPKGDYFVSAGLDNVTADTYFRCASTTKTFTAAAILLLQQQGKLRISDKITDNILGKDAPYVPDTAAYAIPFKDEITIQQLLEHKAGVFDVSNSQIPDNASAPYAGKSYITYVREDLNQSEHTFSFDELVGVVASNHLSYSPPGAGFHYSNTGYSILGKIIERVSGISYASFIEQNLLTPNGLSQTSLPIKGDEQQLPSPYVDGYLYIQGTLHKVTVDNMSPHVAEGNIITTPNNLAKWAELLYSAKAGLNQTYVDQMKDVKPTGEEHVLYGLGTTYTDGLGYGHNGAHIGYLTVMRYDPTTNVTVVIFVSVLNADDPLGELNLMYDVGLSAKQLMGYAK